MTEHLKSILAKKYDKPSDIKEMLHSVSIPVTSVDLTGSIENMWFNVLEEAYKVKKIDKIIDIATNKYGSNETEYEYELNSAKDRYISEKNNNIRNSIRNHQTSTKSPNINKNRVKYKKVFIDIYKEQITIEVLKNNYLKKDYYESVLLLYWRGDVRSVGFHLYIDRNKSVNLEDFVSLLVMNDYTKIVIWMDCWLTDNDLNLLKKRFIEVAPKNSARELHVISTKGEINDTHSKSLESHFNKVSERLNTVALKNIYNTLEELLKDLDNLCIIKK